MFDTLQNNQRLYYKGTVKLFFIPWFVPLLIYPKLSFMFIEITLLIPQSESYYDLELVQMQAP